MKFVAVFLMTLGLCLATPVQEQDERVSANMKREAEVAVIRNATQCVYKPTEKVFLCRGISGEVQCPAIFEWSGEHRFNLFGLGFAPDFVSADSKEVKGLERFWLYPRSLDNNSTYLNHTLVVEGGLRDLILYYGEKMIEFGFRVTDLSCYERIVKLIKVSPVEHIVELQSELVVKPVAPLIGEVLYLDSQISKRWGFGWGWGLGGWGFGGLFSPFGLWGR
jgi:hypothetical protein